MNAAAAALAEWEAGLCATPAAWPLNPVRQRTAAAALPSGTSRAGSITAWAIFLRFHV